MLSSPVKMVSSLYQLPTDIVIVERLILFLVIIWDIVISGSLSDLSSHKAYSQLINASRRVINSVLSQNCFKRVFTFVHIITF